MISKKSVTYYTNAWANIRVSFPENKIYCQWCLFCGYHHGLRKAYCLITNEDLPYYTSSRGNQCPFQVEEG